MSTTRRRNNEYQNPTKIMLPTKLGRLSNYYLIQATQI